MSFDIAVTVRLGETVVGGLVPEDGRDSGLTVLFGPSGVGKSSVLNMVAGLLRPAAGHVRVGGRTLFDAAAGIDMPVAERCCGYVFQEPRLFPHRRVAANLRYGMGRGRRRSVMTTSSSFWRWADCWIAGPRRCRAARRSGWRSAGRCCRARDSC